MTMHAEDHAADAHPQRQRDPEDRLGGDVFGVAVVEGRLDPDPEQHQAAEQRADAEQQEVARALAQLVAVVARRRRRR